MQVHFNADVQLGLLVGFVWPDRQLVQFEHCCVISQGDIVEVDKFVLKHQLCGSNFEGHSFTHLSVHFAPHKTTFWHCEGMLKLCGIKSNLIV